MNIEMGLVYISIKSSTAQTISYGLSTRNASKTASPSLQVTMVGRRRTTDIDQEDWEQIAVRT